MIKETLIIIDENKLTDSGVPMPLVLVNGKPFLELWLRYLDQWAFSCVHFMAGKWNEEIRNIYSESYLSLKLNYIDQKSGIPELSEIIDAAVHFSVPQVLFIYPECFFNVNLRRLEDFHQVKEADFSIVVRFALKRTNEGILSLDDEYRITGFAPEDAEPDEEYMEGCMMLVKLSSLKKLPVPGSEIFNSSLVVNYAHQFKVFGLRCFSEFLDIMRHEDLEKARMQMYLYGD